MNFHSESIDRLFDTILGLQTREDCYAYFADLCTVRELQDMAQRLDVAILLREGKNYQEISAQTAVSSATISRVNRCLTYGSGGYRTMLQRLEKTQQPEND